VENAADGISDVVRDAVNGGWTRVLGKLTGEFIAIDEDTGKIVWQFQTSSGINAQPITYTHNGRQYVTVLSGSAAGLRQKGRPRGRYSRAGRCGRLR